MTDRRHGPGPIVHGPSLTDPNRYIVELPGQGAPTLMTRDEIAAIPIGPQWFSGTQTGLIASWWSRDVAEQHGEQLGVVVGQIKAMRVDGVEHDVPVLCDASGRPLRMDGHASR